MSGTEIVFAATGVIFAVVGGAWALVRIVVEQFSKSLDLRFLEQEKARVEGRKVFDERFTQIDNAQRRFERELLEMQADLPLHYVRREDHIRFETVINAKMDSLNSKLDLIAERQKGTQ